MPGMLHGRVVRPPAFGAKLESVDEGSIKDIPGVVKVVRQGNFLGVVAENEWARDQGRAQAQGVLVQMGGPAGSGQALRACAREQNRQGRGDQQCRQHRSEALGQDGAKKLNATYDFAIHTHGSIGPSCAVAEFKDGKLTSWSASQATHNLRKQLAKMFALPPENVRCIYFEGSGCYGRNGHEDAAADAALLAKAVGQAGARAMVAGRRAWLGSERPADADRSARGARRLGRRHGLGIGVLHSAADAERLRCAARGGDAGGNAVRRPHSRPATSSRTRHIPYKFANIKTVCHRLETTPFRPSWIRTPGRMQNTYANECFMDELAAAAGADPIEFRLKYLDPADKRGIEVLNRVAALAKWEKRPSPQARARAAMW